MKKTIALWLARRAERKTRNTRRRLRDMIREENAAIAATEKRARGLRIYAAWLGAEPPPRIVTAAWTNTPRRRIEDIVLVRKEAA